MFWLDKIVLDFFVGLRVEWLSFLMLVITYSGSYVLVGGLTFLTAISFFIHKHRSSILPLLVAVGGSGVSVYLLKHIFYRARPLAEALYLETSSSFPSGHATMAMALYGFIFWAVYKFDHHKLKKIFLIFLGILIPLVGASRLYLGVHHLSDVLAGFAIGLVWLSISRLIAKSESARLLGNERL